MCLGLVKSPHTSQRTYGATATRPRTTSRCKTVISSLSTSPVLRVLCIWTRHPRAIRRRSGRRAELVRAFERRFQRLSRPLYAGGQGSIWTPCGLSHGVTQLDYDKRNRPRERRLLVGDVCAGDHGLHEHSSGQLRRCRNASSGQRVPNGPELAGALSELAGNFSEPRASATESTGNFTDESNNLTIIQNLSVPNPSDLAYSTAGDNFLEMHYLASVSGNCGGPTPVYVKDYPQDYGSTPSNLSGQAFWESPDIIVVRHGQPVDAGTPPSDPQVTAGNSYDVWVRVHNDFGCAPATGVTAQVWWGDPAVRHSQLATGCVPRHRVHT